jgi:hypothetical protein
MSVFAQPSLDTPFMTRILLMLSCLAACDVGSVYQQNGGGPDGGGGGNPDAAGSGSGSNCLNAGTPQQAHVHQSPVQAGNPSNRGLDCMGAGCHGVGGGGPTWTLAGTLWTAATGTTPNPGGIVVVKAGGTTYKAIADTDGNFYTPLTVTFPATAEATKCPNVMNMSAQLTQGQGGCNSCHTTTPPATTSPLYLAQ